MPSCSSGSRIADPVACKALTGRTGGWAKVAFMVDATGKPFEVAVTRSTGNKALDDMAKKAIEASTFEPGLLNGKPIESGSELKIIVWEGPKSAGARREFSRAYQELTQAVEAGDRAAADARMKQLVVTSLYEDAYVGMATYLYASKWGDQKQQLDGLSRAIAEEDTTHALPNDMFKAALIVRMRLQVAMRLYAEALASFKTLQKAGMDEGTAVQLGRVVEKLEKIRSDDGAYDMQGEMPDGSWHLKLFKRHFRAEVHDGSIAQVKLRCQKHYVSFAFDPKLEYQVDSKDGDCFMELLGAAGTQFTLTQF